MIVVFDLDGVLVNPDKGSKLMMEALSCIEFVYAQGHIIALATFNREALRILRWHKIDIFFTDIHVCDFRFKSEMLAAIKSRFPEEHELVYFDDVYANVRECRQAGFHAEEVYAKYGISVVDLKRAGVC